MNLLLEALSNHLGVVIGGLIGIGGSIVIWTIDFFFGAKKRANDAVAIKIAERKLESTNKYYGIMKWFEAILKQKNLRMASQLGAKPVFDKVISYQEFITDNRAYLSDELSKHWYIVRNEVIKFLEAEHRDEDTKEIESACIKKIKRACELSLEELGKQPLSLSND